jgi:3-hydroxyisobutyryl-CoA hydrolase
LKLLSEDDYRRYPHAKYSIPREQDIEAFVRQGGKSHKETINHFVQQKKGKQGIREIVTEIVTRKTRGSENGLVWLETLPADS